MINFRSFKYIMINWGDICMTDQKYSYYMSSTAMNYDKLAILQSGLWVVTFI